MFTRKRMGFTLVELLVVIAIIGMLVGILLPAVQAARNAGRRTQNSNNLKNLGVAMMSYSESKNHLPALRFIRPSGKISKTEKEYPLARNSVSWAFELLPYLEQQNIYDRLDKSKPVSHPNNQLAMGQALEIFANPQLSEPRNNCGFSGGGNTTGTCIDYAANRGLFNVENSDEDQFTMSFTKNAKFVGPFIHNARVTTAHVKDGLSQTFAIGDKWINLATMQSDQVGLAGASNAAIMRGPIVKFANGFPESQEPGGYYPTAMDESTNKFGGAGGNQMAMCYLDGHVEWIDYSTAPGAFAAQCTIDGGEVITE